MTIVQSDINPHSYYQYFSKVKFLYTTWIQFCQANFNLFVIFGNMKNVYILLQLLKKVQPLYMYMYLGE